jgi:protein-L-isoaspartate O-methyltransferase
MDREISKTSLPEEGSGERGERSTRAVSVAKFIPLKGMRAIDLGSHEGYNCFDLADLGCAEVVGIEIRDRFLEKANATKIAENYPQVSFQKCDVRTIDEAGLGKFDLCLCTGLLYHMQNPFNLLKRLRNLCRYLVLETHVSPTLPALFFAAKKYRRYLTLRTHRIQLDGEEFTGRFNVFPVEQDMQQTSGSVVSHTTFWLSRESLERALRLAGFRLIASYLGKTPAGQPEIPVQHGIRRSKIFIVAEALEPERVIPVKPASEPRSA